MGQCAWPQAVCEDKYPLMKTTIPPPLRYPVADNAFHFVEALVRRGGAAGGAFVLRHVVALQPSQPPTCRCACSTDSTCCSRLRASSASRVSFCCPSPRLRRSTSSPPVARILLEEVLRDCMMGSAMSSGFCLDAAGLPAT